MKTISIVPLLACIFATTAHALTDREHLDKWCTQASSVAAGRCIGYLLAAEDALSHDSIEGVRACLPPAIGLSEQHRIVIDWLKANPEAKSLTALGLVARAYAAHYPCGK
jgi:hypothetical protein